MICHQLPVIKLSSLDRINNHNIPILSFFKLGYNEAIGLAKEYAKTKGPGTQAKPEQHAFFRRLLPIVKRTLEKCERENGFM